MRVPSPSHAPQALQHWLLAACQAPRGGLRDKPGKPPDLYHTCYCLAGLGVAQAAAAGAGGGGVVGGEGNRLVAADALLNVTLAALASADAAWAAAGGVQEAGKGGGA